MARRSLFLAGVLLAFPGRLAAQPPEIFLEELVVREREILIDLPDAVADDPLEPGDFQVLVDGRPREVTRVEQASEMPWTIVVYFDRVLASPGTVFYSGLALSERARELTGLGTVEVTVAGSDPDVALAPTRETLPVAQTLAALAAEARVERDRAADQRREEPSALQVRRQLDKLLTFLTSRRPAGPRAVFLVVDGLDLPPEQIALLERADPPGSSPETPALAFRRAARLLAAYGWVAIPVPLRKEGVGVETAPQRELEIFRQSAAPSDHQSGVPPILPGRPPGKTTLAFTGVIDVFIAPQTVVLRALSQATAGTVIGLEEQIGPTLAALSRRWRVWVAEPEAPVDGRLHSLAVSVAERRRVGVPLLSIPMGSTGRRKQARAPEWLRSSTPEGIAEARLEDLLAGRPQTGDLPVEVSARGTPAGLELRFEMPPVQLPDSAPAGPVRLSYAFVRADGTLEIRHETAPGGETLAKGWRHTSRVIPPAGARRMAVLVEALGPERWWGEILAIGEEARRGRP